MGPDVVSIYQKCAYQNTILNKISDIRIFPGKSAFNRLITIFVLAKRRNRKAKMSGRIGRPSPEASSLSCHIETGTFSLQKRIRPISDYALVSEHRIEKF